MKIKNLLWAAAVLFLFNVADAGAAGRREPEEEKTYREKYSERDWAGRRRGYREKSRDLYRKLDLTEEQKEELRKEKKKSYEKKEELRGKLRDKLKQMREALAAGEIDKKRVEVLIDEISSLQREILVKRAEGVYRFREILTDEQWEKIRDKGVEQKRMRDKSRDSYKEMRRHKKK